MNEQTGDYVRGESESLPRDWEFQIAANGGDEVAAAVGILRCSQRAHQAWMDYRAESDESHCSNCGQPYESETADDEDDFDRRCVEQYEQIIAVIERLRSGWDPALLGSSTDIRWDDTAIRPFVEAFAADLERAKGWGGIHLDSDIEGFPPTLAHTIARVAVKHLHLALTEDADHG